MLQPGDIVGARFEVESLIGEGGLAQVYRVRHVDLGSTHALKVLRWEAPQLAERLLLEGRIQAQLRHPNILAVTDVVRHEGSIGLLMEYVDALNLDEYLAQAGALPVAQALELYASILAAVAVAHDAGVLHRDLKPANVLLVRGAGDLVIPKVADFGIAKVLQEEQVAGRTVVGAPLGTPGYLAPEQVLDASRVDERTDIFALGVILYQLLSGDRPFRELSGESHVGSTLKGEFVPLHEREVAMPRPLSDAVSRALEKDQEARFPDVRSLAAAVFVERPDLLDYVGTPRQRTPLSLAAPRKHLERLPSEEIASRSGLTPVPQVSAPASSPTLAPTEPEDTVESAAPPPESAAPPPPQPEPASRRWALLLLPLLLLGAGAWWLGRGSQAPVTNTSGAPASSSVEGGASAPAAVGPGPGQDEAAAEGATDPEEGEAEPAAPMEQPSGRTASGDDEPVARSGNNGAPPSGGGSAPTSSGTEQAAGGATEQASGGRDGPAEPASEQTPESAELRTETPAVGSERAEEPPGEAIEAEPTAPPEPTAEGGRDGVASVDPQDPSEAEAAAPELPAVGGRWSGTASGRPLTLRITSAGESVEGEVTFLLGATPRTLQVSGKVDPQGRMLLQDAGGEVLFEATVAGSSMSGEYRRPGQKRGVSWTATRD